MIAAGATTIEVRSGYGLRVARQIAMHRPSRIFTAHLAAQVARLFEAARRLGLPINLHVEHLSDLNGAVLAAGLGALSCDHLEFVGADGMQAMAQSGTVAVILPGAFYTLRETQTPPIDGLRAAGVPMAVASDFNPGSSPIASLPLSMNMPAPCLA